MYKLFVVLLILVLDHSVLLAETEKPVIQTEQQVIHRAMAFINDVGWYDAMKGIAPTVVPPNAKYKYADWEVKYGDKLIIGVNVWAASHRWWKFPEGSRD